MDIPNYLIEAWYYLNSIYVLRHAIAGSLGSLVGITIGIKKNKDAKTCFKYGVIGGISLVALAEVHDLYETINSSLEQMVETYNTSYIEKAIEATVTSENLENTVITQVESTYNIIPITKEYVVSEFFRRLFQSTYEDILDLVGGVVSAISTSAILYYPVKKIKVHRKNYDEKYFTRVKNNPVIKAIKNFDNKIIEKLLK